MRLPFMSLCDESSENTRSDSVIKVIRETIMGMNAIET